MPSNEQRRQAAKRKLERQLSRRAERAKRRRIIGVVITVVAVVAGVGLIYWLANLGDGDQQAAAETTSTPPAPNASQGPCQYTETPQEPSPKPAGMPEDPGQTPNTGTLKVSLKTSQGEIPLTLDRAKAPCTVQSMDHLVKQKFFDATKCHRMTLSAGLKVLQCGDPQGTGQGGPGYTIKDEPPTDLQPATDPNAQPGSSIYPRGTLAMANTGQPNSGGSQFFMVYGDSMLPPQYSVFGTIDAAGLAVLDKIAAGGVSDAPNPQTGQPNPEDGEPKLPVTIESATVVG